MTLDGGPDSQKAAERDKGRDEQARRIKTAVKRTGQLRDKRQGKGPELPD